MAGVDLRDVTLPIGVMRHCLFDDMGPAWLRLDGKTEYQRGMYPDFVTKAAGTTWFLAGSTASTFKLAKAPYGTATVSSGFEGVAGAIIGSNSITLLLENLPEHDHTFTDDTVTFTQGQGGLLTGVLKVATGPQAASNSKTTGKAGKAKPTPVQNQPLGLVAHLFVFAGRPRS